MGSKVKLKGLNTFLRRLKGPGRKMVHMPKGSEFLTCKGHGNVCRTEWKQIEGSVEIQM